MKSEGRYALPIARLPTHAVSEPRAGWERLALEVVPDGAAALGLLQLVDALDGQVAALVRQVVDGIERLVADLEIAVAELVDQRLDRGLVAAPVASEHVR